MPKCASTWLQKHFFRPRHGFREAVSPYYTYFAFAHPPSFQWEPCRERIDLATPDDLVPVISAEALVGNPLTGGQDGEANLYRMHRTLPEARVLLIIREQESMLRSLYKLLVNFGYPYRIATVLQNDLAVNVPAFDLKYLFYDHIIEAYQQVFGEESVLVLPYEGFKSDPEGFLTIIRDFCEIDSDQRPLKVDTDKRENTNRSLVSIEIKRLYNRYVARTKLSMGGVTTPEEIAGVGNIHPLVPAFFERWLERRFANQVQQMTRGVYVNSNARTESLTGLDLAQYGYQLPQSGGQS
jgi:hypothetical protein